MNCESWLFGQVGVSSHCTQHKVVKYQTQDEAQQNISDYADIFYRANYYIRYCSPNYLEDKKELGLAA